VPMPVIHELVKTLAAGANPRDAKASLARQIVSQYHGEAEAEAAEAAFERKFRSKELESEDITFVGFSGASLIEFLSALDFVPSRSEARRLISQRGVKVNGQTATEETPLKKGDLISIGPRRFYKLDTR
jgi:tyrosyl-tRNA synthetase